MHSFFIIIMAISIVIPLGVRDGGVRPGRRDAGQEGASGRIGENEGREGCQSRYTEEANVSTRDTCAVWIAFSCVTEYSSKIWDFNLASSEIKKKKLNPQAQPCRLATEEEDSVWTEMVSCSMVNGWLFFLDTFKFREKSASTFQQALLKLSDAPVPRPSAYAFYFREDDPEDGREKLAPGRFKAREQVSRHSFEERVGPGSAGYRCLKRFCFVAQSVCIMDHEISRLDGNTSLDKVKLILLLSIYFCRQFCRWCWRRSTTSSSSTSCRWGITRRRSRWDWISSEYGREQSRTDIF